MDPIKKFQQSSTLAEAEEATNKSIVGLLELLHKENRKEFRHIWLALALLAFCIFLVGLAGVLSR